MGMGGTAGGHGGVTGDINVTPLCDIMLVILIIFMVITPMLQKGVDVKLPPAAYALDHPDNEDTVTLAIRVDRQLFLDMLPVPESDLIAAIREKFDVRTDKTLFLKADENLDYGDVLNVMDLCRDGGVEEIALITERMAGGS
jgi:biopolymer transport protein ExbD